MLAEVSATETMVPLPQYPRGLAAYLDLLFQKSPPSVVVAVGVRLGAKMLHILVTPVAEVEWVAALDEEEEPYVVARQHPQAGFVLLA